LYQEVALGSLFDLLRYNLKGIDYIEPLEKPFMTSANVCLFGKVGGFYDSRHVAELREDFSH